MIAAGERAAGFGRTYRLHVPSGATRDDSPRPLVVALHGGLATARIFEKQTGFSELADREDFLVVYPNGIGILGLLRHWNGGWCCARARKAEIDDIGFIDRVIEQVAGEWRVDRERIYLVGYSNGGMLAHRYAAARADRLAAMAIFAGPAGLSRPDGPEATLESQPADALPVLMVHGTADQRLDVDGRDPGRRTVAPLGAVDSAKLWARANRCGEEPQRLVIAAGESQRFCGGSNSPVKVLLIDGWGHEWPGGDRIERSGRESLQGFDLGTTMWRFFEETSRSR